MPHFFERRDFFGNSPAIWVLSALLFVTPVAWWSLKQIRMDNDVESWLSGEDAHLKTLQWAHEQFPVEERIFATWEGSSLNDPRVADVVSRLQPVKDAEGIVRSGSPYVRGVVSPREIAILLQKNDVPPAEAIRRLEGMIVGAGPLRVRLTEAGRKSGQFRHPEDLLAAANSQLKLDVHVLPAESGLAESAAIPGYTTETGEEFAASPAAVLAPSGELMETSTVDHDFALTWRTIGIGTASTQAVCDWLKQLTTNDGQNSMIEETFFVPGSPVAIAIALSEEGLADRPEALKAVQQTLLDAGIPADQIRLGGSAVASHELNTDVAKAIWNPVYPWSQFYKRSVILTSALVGAVLAFIMLRSLRLAIVVLLGGMFTTFLTMSLVPATGGTMNMVLVVMPTLLMVITMSGGIHVANYWRHAPAHDVTTAVVQSCRMAAQPCILSAVTTAIGLASLCTSSLSPVHNFGLYSSIGTLLSIFMILLGIPSLLLLMWRGKPPHSAEQEHPVWKKLGQMLTRRAGWQASVSLLLCVGASVGLMSFRTETKVIRYFPESSKIVQDYWFIESHLAGIVPIETVIKFDQYAQDRSNFFDRMEMVREIQERLRKHPEITGSLSLADFQPVSEAPEENSVFASSRYFKRASTAESRIRSGEIQGSDAFYRVADRQHDLTTPGDAALNHQGDELWRVTAQVNVMTDADYGQIIAQIHEITQEVLRLQPGAGHVVTGTVPLFLRTQQAVLDSLITSSFLAVGVILLIFIIQLRSIPAGCVAMIPNIIPITVVFGLISFAGIRVDIGTMITSSIALGMSVDGTLHFLEWFKKELRSGKKREEAVISTLMHCGPAIWQTSWMVGLGLLVLVPAELLLISRFGWLMATMIGVAMLGDLVLLPQLLASPLGKLFEPRQSPPATKSPVLNGQSSSVPIPHVPQFDVSAASVRYS